MSNTKTTKRVGVVLLSLVLAFIVALTMIVTPAAFAKGEPGNPGNIKTGKTGSLQIHKYRAPGWKDADKKNDGSQLTAPKGAEALKGAVFSIKKVNDVDLTDSTVWAKLKNLTVDGNEVKSGEVKIGTLATAQTQTTNDKGLAAFNGLALGLYYVEETVKPEGVTVGADPFFVTIPFPNHTATAGAVDGWLYDVHVYPKNVKTDKVTKTVNAETPTVSTGSDVQWSITAPIPVAVEPEATFKSFKIVDFLQNGSTLSTTNETVVKVDGIETPLVKGTDYTIAEETYTGTANKIVITFKPVALPKLDKAKGKNITIDLFTTVGTVLADNTVINHIPVRMWEYNTTPGGITPPGNPDIPTPPDNPDVPEPGAPKAYFGDYTVKKVSTQNSQVLSGAEFCVAISMDNANAATVANKGEKCIKTATSNGEGIVTFTDLYRGVVTTAEKQYYIKEIKAPAGFKLDEVKAKKITVGLNTGLAGGDETITNTPYTEKDLPNLPLTGASGKLLMTLGGAAILLFAAGTVIVTRRKKA